MRILKLSDMINIKAHGSNLDGREVAAAVGNLVKELTGRPITTTMTRAGRLEPRACVELAMTSRLLEMYRREDACNQRECDLQ
jgi:hypothetical protein